MRVKRALQVGHTFVFFPHSLMQYEQNRWSHELIRPRGLSTGWMAVKQIPQMVSYSASSCVTEDGGGTSDRADAVAAGAPLGADVVVAMLVSFLCRGCAVVVLLLLLLLLLVAGAAEDSVADSIGVNVPHTRKKKGEVSFCGLKCDSLPLSI